MYREDGRVHDLTLVCYDRLCFREMHCFLSPNMIKMIVCSTKSYAVLAPV